MTPAVRVGVVGFGKWSPTLVRNLAKHATIAWVADPSEAAQERARDAGYVSIGAARTADFDAIDALAIVSPIVTHDAFAQQALDRGLHVLSEKPLATTVRGAFGVKHFMRDRVLMVSSPWLYHTAIIRAGEVARELGAPLWFRSTRTSWDERPLDPIADLLPHDVGILQAWTGQRVYRVSAIVDCAAAPTTASVTLRTEAGMLATIQYSYRDREKRRDTAIGCERGVLTVDGVRLRCSGDDGLRFIATDVADGPEPLDAMCAEFVACIREGRQPRHGNIAEAIHVAEVIEAAHASIREQRVVSV